MTIGSVNINFQVVLKQGHDREAVELHVLSVLLKALANEPSIVEFDVRPGTETKVDPFVPAKLFTYPGPRDAANGPSQEVQALSRALPLAQR